MKRTLALLGTGFLVTVLVDLTFPLMDNRITFLATSLFTFIAAFLLKREGKRKWSQGILLLTPLILFCILISIMNPLTINDIAAFTFIAGITGTLTGFMINLKSSVRSSIFIMAVWVTFVLVSSFKVIPLLLLKKRIEVVTTPLPDFTLKDISTQALIHKKDLRGKVVILEFWSTTCGACIHQFPYMKQVKDHFMNRQNVEVITVNGIDDPDKIKSFLQKRPTGLRTFYDSAGILNKALQVEGIPRTFLIDKKGNIRKIHNGFSKIESDDFMNTMINEIETLCEYK